MSLRGHVHFGFSLSIIPLLQLWRENPRRENPSILPKKSFQNIFWSRNGIDLKFYHLKLTYIQIKKKKLMQSPPRLELTSFCVVVDGLFAWATRLVNHSWHEYRYITGIHIFSNGVFRIRILTKITQPCKLCAVFAFETAKKRKTSCPIRPFKSLLKIRTLWNHYLKSSNSILNAKINTFGRPGIK